MRIATDCAILLRAETVLLERAGEKYLQLRPGRLFRVQPGLLDCRPPPSLRVRLCPGVTGLPRRRLLSANFFDERLEPATCMFRSGGNEDDRRSSNSVGMGGTR